MKKVLFTIILSCAMLVSSAQFTLVSKVNAPDDGDSWGISNFTNNWGVGYNVSDRIMVGAYKQGDNFDMFARYKMNFGYVCFEAPTADMSDNMSIGYGMYIKVYENLSVNPYYMIPLKEDEDGGREGSFNVGLSYNL